MCGYQSIWLRGFLLARCAPGGGSIFRNGETKKAQTKINEQETLFKKRIELELCVC